MKQILLSAVAAAVLCFPCFSVKRAIPWQLGKVTAQDFSAQDTGSYSGKIGTAGVLTVPLRRVYNHVTVQTHDYIYEWIEIGRSFVILAVDDTIDFYRDGDVFVTLDGRGRKHKFGLIGLKKRVPVGP